MTELHAHSAGDTETAEPLKLSPLQTEPIAVLATTAVAVQAISAGVLLAKRQWIAGTVVLLGIAVTSAAATRARSLVTPMSRPQDLDGDPLTPLATHQDD
jgi:hypothetical protein